MEEVWKDIVGYEDKYQISNLGRIKSLKDTHGNYKERMLNPTPNLKGYLGQCISKNGIRKRVTIHRLVAETFIPNPLNLPEVNHKDEDKSNNSVSNLEWCTKKYNINYGTGIKRRSNKIKGIKPSKNTIQAVKESLSKKVYQYTKEGKFIKRWDSTMEAERSGKGYNNTGISKCCIGKLKTYKGFRWSYNKLEIV